MTISMAKAKRSGGLADCKHPNSRKTLALAKRTRKDAKKQKRKLEQYAKQNVVGEKIAWFKDNLPDTETSPLTKQQIVELVDAYRARFDSELELITEKNSVGGGQRNRQNASRQSAIEAMKQREKDEFEGCGLEIPDLTDCGQIELLRSWNGELRYLQNFKLIRFARTK